MGKDILVTIKSALYVKQHLLPHCSVFVLFFFFFHLPVIMVPRPCCRHETFSDSVFTCLLDAKSAEEDFTITKHVK